MRCVVCNIQVVLGDQDEQTVQSQHAKNATGFVRVGEKVHQHDGSMHVWQHFVGNHHQHTLKVRRRQRQLQHLKPHLAPHLSVELGYHRLEERRQRLTTFNGFALGTLLGRLLCQSKLLCYREHQVVSVVQHVPQRCCASATYVRYCVSIASIRRWCIGSATRSAAYWMQSCTRSLRPWPVGYWSAIEGVPYIQSTQSNQPNKSE
jgi:hypothetical protein